MFKQKTPEQLIKEELIDAQRELLKARSGLEYAQAMCQYHEARIRRLQGYASPSTEDTAVGGTD